MKIILPLFLLELSLIGQSQTQIATGLGLCNGIIESTQACSFSVAPVIGSKVYVFMGDNDATGATPTASDNQATGGNTYTRDLLKTDATNGTCVVFSTTVTKSSGTFTVTVDSHGAALTMHVFMEEWAGMTQTTDGTSSAVNPGGSNPPDPGNLTTANNNDVIFGFYRSVANATTGVPITNWILDVGCRASTCGGSGSSYLESRIVNASGTYDPKWTNTLVSAWPACGIAYKAFPSNSGIVHSNVNN